MPLDPSLIVAAAVPFLVKGAESFSKTAGEKLAGKVAEICRTIETKFKGDSYAEETLARSKDKPESEDRQAALKGVLAEKMVEDRSFADQVTKLVEEALKEQRGQARSVFDQSGQTVHGNQTNIAGDVRGPVLSGTFSGPVNARKNE